MRSVFTRPPNTSSLRSSVSTVSLFEFWMLSFIISFQLPVSSFQCVSIWRLVLELDRHYFFPLTTALLGFSGCGAAIFLAVIALRMIM